MQNLSVFLMGNCDFSMATALGVVYRVGGVLVFWSKRLIELSLFTGLIRNKKIVEKLGSQPWKKTF